MPDDANDPACYACDLIAGRAPLPGGRIHATNHWIVEHCTGPLGVGALIVKPRRHVLHVWELSQAELEEMGPLIGATSRVVRRLTACDQVYVCLWSHGGYQAVHIHYVVQPVSETLRDQYADAGPSLQVEMFRRGDIPRVDLVETFCERARNEFSNA
jgi:diadenosine tetraphosphate (Ap4A) HIT family hydrolase